MATVRAIYKNGQLKLLEPVELQDGDEVELLIMPLTDSSIEQAEDSEKKPRIPGMHEGAFTVSDDFDDPLPDEFWLSDSDDELLS
jgi:predicted DNA-binding antitoxin AbrB/MazE fold protein